MTNWVRYQTTARYKGEDSRGKSMLTNLLSFHTHSKVNLLDKKVSLWTTLYREKQQCPGELDG